MAPSDETRPEATDGDPDEGGADVMTAVDQPVAVAPEGAPEEASEEASEEAPDDVSAESLDQSAEEHEDSASEDDESATPKLGPGQELSDEELDRQLLGILFASPDALSEAKLIELLDRPSKERVREALTRATQALADSPLPVFVEKVGGGWRLLTDPSLGDVLRRSRKEDGPEKLSGAALETLAIVAYRQPVTKAEVEAIRGVQSGTLLRALVDRRLARIVGRADQPGHPLLYGTTKDFLDRFGLASLKDLPRDGELVRD